MNRSLDNPTRSADDTPQPRNRGRRRLAGAALATMVAAVALATAPPAVGAPIPTGRGQNGAAAIQALGPRLPAVAAAHGMTADRLRRLFEQDRSLWVDPNGRLLYQEPPAPATAASTGERPAVAAAPFPYSQSFKLHSRPGAEKVIYLDFDGQSVSATAWNTYWGVANIQAGPYDRDGLPGSFSTAEQDDVQAVWQHVSEDFAPFDIDVTTEDPGTAAIARSSTGDANFGTRVLVTNYQSGCLCGGIAWMGTFDQTPNHGDYQPAFVFPSKSTTAKVIAEAASHEVGHNLGLNHDGGSGNTYYLGHGDWAPIMGAGYYEAVTQWSRGEYGGATNTEDDWAVMQGNGAVVRTDDHATTALDYGPSVSAVGLIGTPSDVDTFKLEVDPGPLTLTATPAAVGPDLDIRLELRDVNGTVVATSDPPSGSSGIGGLIATGLGATISVTVPAGTYYLVVDGTGSGTVSTGYSDYGSVGQYSISGTIRPRTWADAGGPGGPAVADGGAVDGGTATPGPVTTSTGVADRGGSADWSD